MKIQLIKLIFFENTFLAFSYAKFSAIFDSRDLKKPQKNATHKRS